MPLHHYFRVPSFDISPESPTAPRLGSIFSSLKRLTAPLNQNDYVSIPEDLKNNSSKPDFSDATGTNVKATGGLYTKFAQGAASGGDLVYAFQSDKNNVYRCDLLETFEFDPNEQFVLDCITASRRVQDFIAESFFGNKKVYMITGLKIATGFSMSASKSREQGPKLKVGVAFTGMGAPVEAGPRLDLTIGSTRDVSHGPSDSKIVFAYRAIKISPKGDGRVKYKDISGAQYELGSDDAEAEESWVVAPLDHDDRSKEFPDSTMIAIEGEDGGN